MCRESNENQKIVLSSTAEKKKCLLLIRSEKNCMFKLGVEKSLILKRNHSPHVSKWSAPKSYNKKYFIFEDKDHKLSKCSGRGGGGSYNIYCKKKVLLHYIYKNYRLSKKLIKKEITFLCFPEARQQRQLLTDYGNRDLLGC